MAIDLTLRNIKGSALSYTELDNNFTNLSSSISSLSGSLNTGSFTGSFSGSGNFTGSFTGSISGSLFINGYSTFPFLSSSLNFANDTAASASGVPLGALYHTSGAIKIRLV